MTTVEQYNLQRCESVIEANMKGFVEVGLALLEIRENRWYKGSGYSSFDTYCRERWSMSKQHASRTIQASEYVRSIDQLSNTESNEPSPMGDPLPTERQVRAAIQAERNGARDEPPETEPFVAIPVDRNEMRCEVIMRELTANPDLARLVRIELMKWYALNS